MEWTATIYTQMAVTCWLISGGHREHGYCAWSMVPASLAPTPNSRRQLTKEDSPLCVFWRHLRMVSETRKSFELVPRVWLQKYWRHLNCTTSVLCVVTRINCVDIIVCFTQGYLPRADLNLAIVMHGVQATKVPWASFPGFFSAWDQVHNISILFLKVVNSDIITIAL